MKQEIRVRETVETISIFESDIDGTYRILWHKSEGPMEEFHVTPDPDETVEEAVRKDLHNRLGP